MKQRLISLIPLLISSVLAYGQHSEWSVYFSSGLFHVNSEVVVEPFYSSINTYTLANSKKDAYVNQPWGPNSGFSYGFGMEFKKVAKRKIIWGVDLGFESLQSKKNIYWINEVSVQNYVPAIGHSTMRNSYINIFPFLGYRIVCNKINIDLQGGGDMAFSPILPHEKAEAKAIATGDVIQCNISSRDHPGSAPVDFRWRVQCAIGYKKWKLFSGYSIGLLNQEGQTAKEHSYARYFRFGISSRIK